jgi:hypothetical protein
MARHFVLNTGAKIPSVGLGTWQADPGVVGDAVYTAVKVRSCSVLQFFSSSSLPLIPLSNLYNKPFFILSILNI